MMEIDSPQQLANIIKKARKGQKITQEQLADFTGLQRVGIVRIEAGQTEPKISTLLKICQMLGLKLELKGFADS